MKRLMSSMFFLCFSMAVAAQKISPEKEIQETIETFFDGFHARDSVMMKSVLTDSTIAQTIGRSKTGEITLTQEDIGKVLQGIVSIPLETQFNEVLHSLEIKVDGPMAHVWTPYSFYTNETLSHCGVNSFQLFRDNENWKIIYLIDTRRKEGCEKKKLK